MTHGNRTCYYEASPEEKAYHKVKFVYTRARDGWAPSYIKIREDYAFTKPDMEVRYEDSN